MLTVLCILAIAGLIAVLAAMATEKVKWYVPVLIISIVQVLACLPLR